MADFDVTFDGVVMMAAPSEEPGVRLTAASVLSGLGVDHDGEPGDAMEQGRRTIGLTSVRCETPEARQALRAAMAADNGPPRPLLVEHQGLDGDRVVYVDSVSATLAAKSESTVSGWWSFDLVWRTRWDHRIFAAAHGDPVTVSGSNPTVTHEGTAVAPWLWTVTGACVHPRLRLIEDPDRVWRFDDLTLTADQVLVVDSRAMTAVVVEDGEDDVDVWARRTGDGGTVPLDFGIAPGAGSHIGFARTSGASTSTVRPLAAW